MKSEWTKKKLSDIADFNPRETIKKGSKAKKIPMDVLRPFYRDIPYYVEECFSGGTKFRNGDTIMARITPCLENGKTAQVSILNDGEVGFGSTEYIVFRAKEGIADKDYLYYLVCSPEVREPAIKSMVGSSGRQRVQTDVVKNLEIDVPSLVEQEKIGSFLKAFDDKIALNDRINKNLADLVQTLYKEQFGNISSEDNTGILSDVCSYSKDKIALSKLNSSTYYSTENMLPNKAGVTEATSLPTMQQTTFCREGDTLISNIRPYFKKILYCDKECGCSSDVLCFTPTQSRYAAYLFSTLYADNFFAFMIAGSKGTKMPRGDKQQIMTYPLVIPSDEELENFNAIAFPALKQIHSNRTEIKKLSALRDTLLPKLMSGELDVSGIDL